ncbi:MAG: CinA family protein [Alphaproteobacteria bacterium]
MFSRHLLDLATETLDGARAKGLRLCTAESCTGGLIAGLLTEIPGSSDVLERGFVTYSNRAKHEMLGVRQAILDTYGAVSRQTALAMAKGALAHADAHICVAVTGIAGPGGGTPDKPAGLVHFATGRASQPGAPPFLNAQERRFGDQSRTRIRLLSVRQALMMLQREIEFFGEREKT